MSHYRNFVVPYDFSLHARAAFFAAVDLAKRLDADVHLVHVVQPPHYAYGYAPYAGAAPPPIDMTGVREDATRALEAIIESVENFSGRLEAQVVEGMRVDAAIRSCADELGADLIVMGTHGRTGLAHVFLGSVAERTLRGASCPVLVVPAPDEDAEDTA